MPRKCQIYSQFRFNPLACTAHEFVSASEQPVSAHQKKVLFCSRSTNIMRLQKALIYLIIFVIFLLGVYEIKSGNVHDFARA